MGGSREIILILLPSIFTLLFLTIFLHCAAIDTITTTQYIKDPQNLISSPDEIFRLGFFSLGNSTNRYVGIWYDNIPGPTIVWVANRDNPINDSSGVLRIANDGNLVVLDGRGNLLWTTNVSDIASRNSIAELLDSGNLVLREANSNNKERILWQSFDHPSNTFLPTMKLGVNLRTGEKLMLTSWKDTDSDPSTGNFALELDPIYSDSQVYLLILVKNGSDNQPHGRRDPWKDWVSFLSMSDSAKKFNFVSDNVKGTVYLTNVDRYSLSRLVLESDGKLVETQWDDHEKKWQRSWWSLATDFCDVYGKCGPFGGCNIRDSPICSCLRGFDPKFKDDWRSGIWSGGCVRRTELQCERKNKTSIDGGKEADGFLKLEMMTDVPDHPNLVEYAGERECANICLNNCSCIAYSHENDTGCMWWTGDLIDIRNPPLRFAVYLHIRVAHSELDDRFESWIQYIHDKKRKKREAMIIIIITVLIGIVSISVGTYFCWRRMTKQRDSYKRWMANKRDSLWRRMAKQRDSFWRWMEKQRGIVKGDMRKNVQKERKRGERKKKMKGMRISVFGMDDAYGEPSDSNMLIRENPELKIFNFETIAIATNKFSEANKLGHGGFGSVYKGKLLDGQELAVKRLSKSSGQGLQEFRNEVLVISKLQHRNLVRLLGCCIEEEEKILIYEYMPNKSLDAFLFDATKRADLDWRKRFQIIEGISRGILYLHRDSRLRVIHRDLKASNILLDEDFNPKISDFGMARIFGGNELQANTRRVVGTYGYMSPEYVIEGRFSEKSDVFSFGVLLLEIVSGKRNTSFYHQELSLRLLGYAFQLWNESKAQSLIDPTLLSEPSFEQEILRCIHVGLLCVQEFALDRPTMSTTLSMLTSEIATLPTPKHPAFTERRVSSDSSSSQNKKRINSINNATITSVGGR